MALSNTLKNVATKLIKKFGIKMILVSSTVGDYDPDGTTITQSESDIIGLVSNYATKDYKEGLIAMGDAPLYTTTEITKDHKLKFDNKSYVVTFVESYPINESIVLYYANIRTDGGV